MPGLDVEIAPSPTSAVGFGFQFERPGLFWLILPRDITMSMRCTSTGRMVTVGACLCPSLACELYLGVRGVSYLSQHI